MYFYNLKDNIINFTKKIYKLFNSLLNNKLFNPYNNNVISQYSSSLLYCTLQYNNFIKNYE